MFRLTTTLTKTPDGHLRVLITATRVFLMTNIGIPCAVICVGRRLEVIGAARQVGETASDRRNRTIFEWLFCVGLPIIFTVLAIVWQGHRFDLFEGMGCYSSNYYSWPWIVFCLVPVLTANIASLVYAGESPVA